MSVALAAYAAPFQARFRRTLQYREAAFAGFVTQCWWGGLKAMVLAGFYGGASSPGGGHGDPLPLGQAITYVWLAQGLLAFTPWGADPDVVVAMRDGSVVHDRLRPVDTYAYWYARSVAWLLGRAVPRLLLMVLFAGVGLPLAGYGQWAMQPPVGVLAFAGFVVSLALGLAVSAATVNLTNAVVVAYGSDRGATVLLLTLVILLSGNEIPLPLFPDWAQAFLSLQPFASILDTPFRIYLGLLHGTALVRATALQAFWVVVLVALGRAYLSRALSRVEVNGG